jgi:phage gpG-like protein
MTAFTITVEDQAVHEALQALAARMDKLAPVLTAIGDDITERTKRRFDTSSGPDGAAWAPNSAATLGMLASRLGGQKSKVKKDGSLNASGRRALANKKPLIDSGFLRQQIMPRVSGNTLTVSATPAYAAIQQFGGQAGKGRKVTIPARPYLPVRLDGTLYLQEQALVLQSLNDFLDHGHR